MGSASLPGGLSGSQPWGCVGSCIPAWGLFPLVLSSVNVSVAGGLGAGISGSPILLKVGFRIRGFFSVCLQEIHSKS